MKKVLFLFSCMMSFYAQSTFAAGEYDPMAKPNIVKVNLMSLGFKNFGLQYERVLGKKISVACQVRLMPKGSILGAGAIDNAIGSDSMSIADFKIGSFSVTPEFRYYPRHAGKGFYFAPYLRYRTMNMEVPIDYTDGNGAAQSVYAKGKFSSIMGGLMIGSQFNLSKSITLDWYILGFQYGSTKVDVDVTTSKTLSADDQADISSNINDFTSNFNHIKTTVGSNGGSISGTLGALGFRGFGLSLGYKF